MKWLPAQDCSHLLEKSLILCADKANLITSRPCARWFWERYEANSRQAHSGSKPTDSFFIRGQLIPPVISRRYRDEKKKAFWGRNLFSSSALSFTASFRLFIYPRGRNSKCKEQSVCRDGSRVDAISEKQEAPVVIYHSHSQHRWELKMHPTPNTLFTKQWWFSSYERDESLRATSGENNKGEGAPNRRWMDLFYLQMIPHTVQATLFM